MTHALDVDHLTVRFGARAVVRDVSFHVDRGEIVVLLGPNGAGKTTTTETLLGFRAPDEGRVRVHGVDPWRDHALAITRVGALLQRGGVWAPLSPRRVLDLTASYYARSAPVDALIERLGLTTCAATPWRRLSGGEQQRTLLALALLGEPDALVLDEPTAAVDPEGHLLVRTLLRDERARGTSILLTTHQLADAEALADRIVIMDHGEVLTQGTVADLAKSSSTIFSTSGPVDVAALASSLGLAVHEHDDGSYRVALEADAAAERLTNALRSLGVQLTSLRTTATLEESYLATLAAHRSEAR